MSGIMQRLRRVTHEQHVRLEQTLDFRSRFASRDRYRDLLERMLGLHAPLEQALLRLDWSGTGVSLGERRKTAWLEQDLESLGATSRGIAALPRCIELPQLDHVARGVGCLYVLEGSTLGGRVIARQLERTLGIREDRGGRFYSSYGGHLEIMWSRFGAAAERCCASDPAADQACAAARDTFDCFQTWFGRDRRAQVEESGSPAAVGDARASP